MATWACNSILCDIYPQCVVVPAKSMPMYVVVVRWVFLTICRRVSSCSYQVFCVVKVRRVCLTISNLFIKREKKVVIMSTYMCQGVAVTR